MATVVCGGCSGHGDVGVTQFGHVPCMRCGGSGRVEASDSSTSYGSSRGGPSSDDVAMWVYGSLMLVGFLGIWLGVYVAAFHALKPLGEGWVLPAFAVGLVAALTPVLFRRIRVPIYLGVGGLIAFGFFALVGLSALGR